MTSRPLGSCGNDIPGTLGTHVDLDLRINRLIRVKTNQGGTDNQWGNEQREGGQTQEVKTARENRKDSKDNILKHKKNSINLKFNLRKCGTH